MSRAIEKKAPPLKFLLECSDISLGNFEMARLSEVANMRAQMIELFDKLVDVSAQAVLAAWLRTIDREELKRQLLESSTVTLGRIMSEAREGIRNGGRNDEEAENYHNLLPPEERRKRRRDSIKRSRERNIAEGKCERCSQPQDRNSVRLCTKHLAILREKDRKHREKNGVQIGTQGRQPGTLASLAVNRENKTRALLAERGVKPARAAVSLKAAKEALLAAMPDKAHAMTQAELFEKAGVITKTTGQRALNALLAEKQIQRIGQGGPRDVYRYFATQGLSE